MLTFSDQLGRIIHLHSFPKRIISLVPSQTELLFDLGLRDEVIGITKFCVHPQQWFHKKTRVGGTKNLNIELITSLEPDLIIANNEENTKEQVEGLATKYPVWISDVHNLETALQMISSVGELTNKVQRASLIADQIKEGFDQLQTGLVRRNITSDEGSNEPQTAYIIWKDPYMTVGSDTFIHDMLKAAGLKNMFEHLTRYPEIKIADLQAKNCQLLLLSTEPYPFNQKHVDELQIHLPDTKIILVDGEMFSWYGSRLLKVPGYFRKVFEVWG